MTTWDTNVISAAAGVVQAFLALLAFVATAVAAYAAGDAAQSWRRTLEHDRLDMGSARRET